MPPKKTGKKAASKKAVPKKKAAGKKKSPAKNQARKKKQDYSDSDSSSNSSSSSSNTASASSASSSSSSSSSASSASSSSVQPLKKKKISAPTPKKKAVVSPKKQSPAKKKQQEKKEESDSSSSSSDDDVVPISKTSSSSSGKASGREEDCVASTTANITVDEDEIPYTDGKYSDRDTLAKTFNNINATVPEHDDPDTLVAQHLPGMATALGFDLSSSLVIYAFAWKAECKTPLSISREEWADGWRRCGQNVASTKLKAAKSVIDSIVYETMPDEAFPRFYQFVFGWCRENAGSKVLALDTAADLWDLIFKEHDSKSTVTEFIKYLRDKTKVVAITRDLWNMMPEFLDQDLDDWDPMNAWPSLMDEFVQHRAKQAATTKLD